MTGTKIKSIIKKLEAMLVQNEIDSTSENVIAYFQLVCSNLPNWYRDKDLGIIDSHWNTITEQIKNTLNGTNITTTPGNRYTTVTEAGNAYFDEEDDDDTG